MIRAYIFGDHIKLSPTTGAVEQMVQQKVKYTVQ